MKNADDTMGSVELPKVPEIISGSKLSLLPKATVCLLRQLQIARDIMRASPWGTFRTKDFTSDCFSHHHTAQGFFILLTW
ncbi:MAG TPA: hypothetical protein VLG11_01915 [Candidatus Saccharimonadales bacterium]|nr:hypothetical protein [Candidatus Saccharimonadales bacterium]